LTSDTCVTNRLSDLPIPPEQLSISSPNVAIADAGASGHYFNLSASPFLSNIQDALEPLQVSMPNGSRITSTHLGVLQIAGEGETVHLFREEQLGMSLLSVGKLCDRGMSVIYSKGEVRVLSDRGRLVMKGWRD
jgi:hypothetical protein